MRTDPLTHSLITMHLPAPIELPDVRTGSPVAFVKRASVGGPARVTVTTEAGSSEDFDAVVLATHRCGREGGRADIDADCCRFIIGRSLMLHARTV